MVIYFGHGNGWPSPYPKDSAYTTKDGFGLNATAGNGDSNTKYYGEPYVSTLDLAPNAVILLHHLCYASGNSEPGNAAPTRSVAKQRVDNYGAGFLRAGVSAVIADGHRGAVDYLRALFTTDQRLVDLWRTQPNYHGNEFSFASVRTSGKTALMDPDTSTSGYYRSMVGNPNVTTTQVLERRSRESAAAARLCRHERLQRPLELEVRGLHPVDLRREDHERLHRHPLLPGVRRHPRPDGQLHRPGDGPPGRDAGLLQRRQRPDA